MSKGYIKKKNSILKFPKSEIRNPKLKCPLFIFISKKRKEKLFIFACRLNTTIFTI